MSASDLSTNEKKQIVSEQLNLLTENGVKTIEINDFIKKHFSHTDENGFEFQSYINVKDYVDKNGETKKAGTKSNLTLEQYAHYYKTGKIVDATGKEVRYYPVKPNEVQYKELRPCFGNKPMMVIDIDGINENGDIMFEELMNHDDLFDELRHCSFFVSRKKFLPHFIFYITDLPENVSGNHQDVLTGFKGDILLNHCWERCDDEMFKLYHYNDDLTSISWNTVKQWIDKDSVFGKKVLKEKKEKKQNKDTSSVISDITTDSETVSTQNETQIAEKCKQINNLVNDIHSYDEDYFASYEVWCRLGFIIYNETNGKEKGAELFINISKDLESTSGKRQDRDEVMKQYYKGLTGKTREKKLGIATLKKWLQDLKPEEEKEQEITRDDIRQSKIYLEFKAEFEKKNFKLAGMNRYVRQSKDERGHQTVNIYTIADFTTLNNDLQQPSFTITKSKFSKEVVKFLNLWFEDPTKRCYQSIKFDPTQEFESEDYQSKPIDEKFYNMFTGFPNNDVTVEPLKEEDSDYLKLMKWLINDDIVYEYMKCWIASIIQKPEMKTKVAPVFYSETKGSGKNSVIDGIIALLGRLNCAMIESIDDITRNFNAHFCNKLFIYGDEINANARKVVSRLKQIITRPTQNLEKKGIDAIEIDDFTNYAFTTNEENCFKIEDGDRRFLMIHTREEQQTELSKKSYAEINNETKIKQLFAFFKNYDTEKSGFKIGICPVISTKYKEELQTEDKPAYIQMLYENPKRWICGKYSSTELFRLSQQFAKDHYLQSHYTLTKFGTDIKKYISTTRTKTGMVYKFPDAELELLKMLYDADKKYYKYVFGLGSNEEPDFTENYEIDEVVM